MGVDLEAAFKAARPHWLITITLPSVTIRLVSPDPVNPLTVYDATGRPFTYHPGYLGDAARLKHSVLGDVPSVSLEFFIPTVYRVAYPASLSWTRARCEVAQWFEGTTWENRRVLLDDVLTNVAVGEADEPVTATVSAQTVDSGRALDPSAIIGPLTWADTANIPTGADTQPDGSDVLPNEDYFQRAHESVGVTYPEIIGFPRWARIWCVGDEVDADQVSTDLVPRKFLVCAGPLNDTLGTSNNRTMRYKTASDEWVEYGVACSEDADDTGRAVVTCDQIPVFESGVYNYSFVGYTITGDSSHGLGDDSFANTTNMSLLSPGDQIRLSVDGDEDWVKVAKFTASLTSTVPSNPTSYYNIVGTYQDYGGSYGASYSLIKNPLPAAGGAAFIDCSTDGGQPSPIDSSRALRRANEVLYTYLRRSVGIRVDFDSLANDATLAAYQIDGVLDTPGISPLAWIQSEILPLLPAAMSWEGAGLRFRNLDPLRRRPRTSIKVGRQGLDGDRLSKRPVMSPDSVINAITVRYDFDATVGKFRNAVTTPPVGYSNAAPESAGFIVNERAILSEALYGRRTVEIEARWTADETTARAVGNSVLNRFHKPRWRIAYHLVPRFGFLDVADVIEITDEELGIGPESVRILEIEHSNDGPVVVVEEMG